MKEYFKQQEAFSSQDDAELTAIFFEKYWLYSSDILHQWGAIQEQIFFDKSIDVPNQVFHPEYKLLPMVGGILFGKKDFELLKDCMRFSGDKEFVIVENYDENNPPHKSGPPLRFKFPVDINWEELNNGGYISIELFGMPHKNYYVFGDTGNWGKYTASDNDKPIEIIGCKESCLNYFKETFKEYAGDYNRIFEFLPEAYQNNEWLR